LVALPDRKTGSHFFGEALSAQHVMTAGGIEMNRPFDSPWQTFRRLADYRGRSTRSELLYFGLLMTLTGYLVSFLASGTRYAGEEAVRSLFLAGFLVPLIPMLVRRLHDQSRSGWWLLAGLPALAAILVEQSRRHSGGAEPLLEGAGPVAIVALLSALAVLALALLPEDRNANRYGPNPRQSQAGETG
jgi:uncharacterized membrane protein YhaH (DUF805 family)